MEKNTTNEWFNKYSVVLAYIANTPAGRELLQIPANLKIGDKNGYPVHSIGHNFYRIPTNNSPFNLPEKKNVFNSKVFNDNYITSLILNEWDVFNDLVSWAFQDVCVRKTYGVTELKPTLQKVDIIEKPTLTSEKKTQHGVIEYDHYLNPAIEYKQTALLYGEYGDKKTSFSRAYLRFDIADVLGVTDLSPLIERGNISLTFEDIEQGSLGERAGYVVSGASTDPKLFSEKLTMFSGAPRLERNVEFNTLIASQGEIVPESNIVELGIVPFADVLIHKDKNKETNKKEIRGTSDRGFLILTGKNAPCLTIEHSIYGKPKYESTHN